MKVIIKVSETPYAKLADKYGALKIDGVMYLYLHQHDALIQKVLYPKYKEHKNFDDFLKAIDK